MDSSTHSGWSRALRGRAPRDIADAARRELAVRSFAYFQRASWHVVEPTREQLPSAAIDGITAALQAVADGRIKRLAISTCPGTSKSLVGVVQFPAWLLLRSGGTARIMAGSYAWDFASRDSRRCRDLVQSEWYQAQVNGAWALREDAARQDDWWTTTSGRRLIVSVGGKALGERCTFQIMDDALSGADVHSTTAKLEAVRWINEVLPSRLEDVDNEPRILIGQRLCVDDPLADVIRQGWKYLYLPAVLGDGDPCELTDDAGEPVWRDPRAPDEPIMSLLGHGALERLRLELGSTAFAAQYLQRPSDDSSSMVPRAWWRFWRPDHVPAGTARPAGCDTESIAVDLPATFDRIVITADLTFGAVDGDWAVCQAWGAHRSGRYLLDQWRKRAGFEESLLAIEAMWKRWPGAKVAIEKAAHGAAVIEQIKKRIPGVVALKPIGKKAQRLSAAAPTIESGCCFLPLGATYLADLVDEVAGSTKHDDMADCVAYAIIDLNGKPALVSHGGYGG